MTPKIGYLLPTRENIMEGRPEGKLLLDLATRAEGIGYDSLWVGDSLLARPRHEPLTLLAAVAGCTSKVKLGTAVLLPALRNPVVMAHQVATLDQVSEGRVILGVGIAADNPAIRAEFEAASVPYEKRVGRMLEGLRLCRALWRGEPVDWEGRWTVQQGVLGPTPHQAGGPPIWIGSLAPAGLERAGKYFDGWFPTGPDPEGYAERWRTVRQIASDAGRDENALTGAVYLTVSLGPEAQAEATVNDYLERYYQAPAAMMRSWQAVYAGPVEGFGETLQAYVDAGVSHLMLRFAGEHERHLEQAAGVWNDLGLG